MRHLNIGIRLALLAAVGLALLPFIWTGWLAERAFVRAGKLLKPKF